MFRLFDASCPTVLREDTTDLHRCPFIRSVQHRDTRINPARAVGKHATALASPQSPLRLGTHAHAPEPPCSPGGLPHLALSGGQRGARAQTPGSPAPCHGLWAGHGCEQRTYMTGRVQTGQVWKQQARQALRGRDGMPWAWEDG